MEKFERLLGKDNPLLKSLESRGFTNPTDIQEKSIPPIMEGKDVIGGAATGSGKTLAFASGIIKNAKSGFGIQGLILTPTRELAVQITKEIKDFSRFKKLEVISVYGGVAMPPQVRGLTKAEIVVATPGRILDHINKRSVDLTHVNTLVLDEADRMLDMGFIEDVEKIISYCPNERQTMLFSATISEDISYLARRHLKEPVEISVDQQVDPKKLEQVYYDVEDNLKYSLLKHLIENEKSNLVMIFCNTRKNVDFVANNLKFMGIEAVPIHGGLSQEKRTKMLETFNSKKVLVLVATDVAARGLDIKGVTHVYNFDMPPSEKEYIHRIGRTARAGKEGKVINIIASRDYENFQEIMTGDFNIKREETPFVQRARIRWMPERKGERRDRQQGRGGRSRGTSPRSPKSSRGRPQKRDSGRRQDNSRGKHSNKTSYRGRPSRNRRR